MFSMIQRVRQLGVRAPLAAALISTLLASVQCGAPRDLGSAENVGTETGAALTRPTVNPPALSVSAEVGVLPSSGSVGDDGQYRYRIPIEVPQGRAGLTSKWSRSMP